MPEYGVECCPYLGTRGDPAWYEPYPTSRAVCLARMKDLSDERQRALCLSREYVGCRRLASGTRARRATPAVARLPLWLSILVILLTVSVAWGVLGLIDRDRSDSSIDSLGLSNALLQTTPATRIQLIEPTVPVTPSAAKADGSAAIPHITAPPGTPTPVSPTPSATPQVKHHVVQPGESLSGIAGLYGVTVDALARVNGMRGDAVLRAGARLTIPVAGTVYLVQSGDTLTSVARMLGVSVDALSAANKLARTATLTTGERLTIPAR